MDLAHRTGSHTCQRASLLGRECSRLRGARPLEIGARLLLVQLPLRPCRHGRRRSFPGKPSLAHRGGRAAAVRVLGGSASHLRASDAELPAPACGARAKPLDLPRDRARGVRARGLAMDRLPHLLREPGAGTISRDGSCECRRGPIPGGLRDVGLLHPRDRHAAARADPRAGPGEVAALGLRDRRHTVCVPADVVPASGGLAPVRRRLRPAPGDGDPDRLRLRRCALPLPRYRHHHPPERRLRLAGCSDDGDHRGARLADRAKRLRACGAPDNSSPWRSGWSQV